MIKNIIEKLNESFGLTVEHESTSNVTFLRIKGIDNCSLAKWIKSEFEGLKITVEEIEGYKFSDHGWVKMEKSQTKESHVVMTR